MARFTRKAKIQSRGAGRVPLSSSGGGVVIQKALERLGLEQILADVGMVRQGWAPAKVVFNLVLQAWLQGEAVSPSGLRRVEGSPTASVRTGRVGHR